MWEYVEPVLFALVMLRLLSWLVPEWRRGRKWATELATRAPISDEDLVAQHFAAVNMAASVLGKVRRAFAKHTGYPAENLLPDDDLTFFSYELDMLDLVDELEAEFGITLTDADIERTPSTVRAVSLLVVEKLDEKRQAIPE